MMCRTGFTAIARASVLAAKKERSASGTVIAIILEYRRGTPSEVLSNSSVSAPRRLRARPLRGSRERLFDRQGHSKDSAAGLIRRCRQAPAMGLGNRAADREAHA